MTASEISKLIWSFVGALFVFIASIGLLGMVNAQQQTNASIECVKVGGTMHDNRCVSK